MPKVTQDRKRQAEELYRGTVDSYNPRGGYGYIIPDESPAENELLLVHRNSLRHSAERIRTGDRVVFNVVQVPRGLLATDVRLEMEDADENPELSEGAVGRVAEFFPNRGFGFIDVTDGRRAFFHVSYLETPTLDLLAVGSHVRCNLVQTIRGLQARDIEVAGYTAILDKSDTAAPEPHEILARAILARDSRQYDKARQLYEKGLASSPSVQLILSYAAMEKNANRKSAAMAIYEKGIHLFPRMAKLREDAGILAASMRNPARAIEFLEAALRLCRTTHQAGEKGVLLALARVHTKLGGRDSLAKAMEYYEAARRVPSRSHDLASADILAMSTAKIRLQHYRGDLAYNFVRNCGFHIVRASLLPQSSAGADMVVAIDSAEINESYGISGNILVRCMFQSAFSQHDLNELDRTITDYAETDLVSDQVALLVLSSLPDALQQALFKRVEDRTRLLPAIVPVPQEIIETSPSALSALRDVLDQWIFRRDLFALNFPVVGKRFFGRDKTLAKLRESILSGTPAGIFGLRKVGKTSLLKETARRAGESGDLIVYLDLLRVPADIGDTRWLYWRIANSLFEEVGRRKFLKMNWRLGGSFEDFLEIPSGYPVATAFDSDLSHLLKQIANAPVSPKPKIVLLLDEIERILPTALGKPGFEGFFDFFSYLRGVSQETADLVVMVTGANAAIAEISQFDGRDNPVFNYFQEIYLQLLEPNECYTMMRTLGRGMGLRFAPEACALVYTLTGGHPFFTREFCSFVSSQYADRPLEISVTHVENVLDHYLEVAGKDFREIMDRLSRDYPAERDLCVKLAHADGPLQLEDLRGSAPAAGLSVRHLVGYQIVSVVGGKVSLTMDLLRRWLRVR